MYNSHPSVLENWDRDARAMEGHRCLEAGTEDLTLGITENKYNSGGAQNAPSSVGTRARSQS